MKTKSMFTAFTFKALLVITCITVGFAGFTKCEAQSPAGKWNRVSGKEFFTEESAKKLGKTFVEVPMASAGSSVIEFKADHTFIKTLSGAYHPKPVSLTGSWSVSGNQFEMKMDPNQPDPKTNPKKDAAPTSNTISISGNTMTVSFPVTANNSNPLINEMNKSIKKIEETYKKM